MRRIGNVAPVVSCGESGLTLRSMLPLVALGHGTTFVMMGTGVLRCSACSHSSHINDLMVGGGKVCCPACGRVFHEDD